MEDQTLKYIPMGIKPEFIEGFDGPNGPGGGTGGITGQVLGLDGGTFLKPTI